MPSLSSFFTTCTPLVFIGRQISDLFLCTAPSPVLASRHIQSAWVPLVVHILPPLITQSPPTRLARGLERGDVGAGADFGDAEAGDVVAGDRGRQELLRSSSLP